MFCRCIVAGACVIVLAGCQQLGADRGVHASPSTPVSPSSVPLAPGAGPQASTAAGALPFHSEVTWQAEQVPVPEGRCTQPIPEGLSYLWLSKISGTATSTHLGTGPYYIELCLYGVLSDPGGGPGANGMPTGWYAPVQIWTAANGDTLLASGELLGFTSPPGTPGFKFIESVTFKHGGTGRFAYAEGEGKGLVDSAAQTAVYDGWIRYGKKQK